MLTEISIPAIGRRQGSAYLKMERVVGDFAIVGAAAFVELDERDMARKINIVYLPSGTDPLFQMK